MGYLFDILRDLWDGSILVWLCSHLACGLQNQASFPYLPSIRCQASFPISLHYKGKFFFIFLQSRANDFSSQQGQASFPHFWSPQSQSSFHRFCHISVRQVFHICPKYLFDHSLFGTFFADQTPFYRMSEKQSWRQRFDMPSVSLWMSM